MLLKVLDVCLQPDFEDMVVLSILDEIRERNTGMFEKGVI
jgi:hypothetical protein